MTGGCRPPRAVVLMMHRCRHSPATPHLIRGYRLFPATLRMICGYHRLPTTAYPADGCYRPAKTILLAGAGSRLWRRKGADGCPVGRNRR